MMASFVKHKFNCMLGIATITMSVNYIVMLSGSVIVGNMVGGDGLAGVNVCAPVFGFASFLASILSVGTALVFSNAMGAFDERRAKGVFTQSLLMAIAMGTAIYVAMTVGEKCFLDFSGVTGSIRAQASAYWEWMSAAMALTPAVLLMEAMVYADGDGLVAAIMGAIHVSGSIGLSILFTDIMGNAGGAAAGTAATMVAVLAVSSLHFLRRHNHLRHQPHFSISDLGAVCAASLADSTIYLCWGLLIAIVNKFTVVRFGQEFLPVVAMAASVVEFSIVFDGVGEALIPLGGMYDGEGNLPALRELARHSAIMATLEGLVCGVVFFALAPWLASWYGMRGDSANLLPAAVVMVRSLAAAMPFMGFLMMANTHFLVVHHIPFAVSVTVMKDFVFPCVFALALGWIGGFDAIWIGFAVGYAVSAVYPFAFVLLRYGRDSFPWLISRDDGKSINFSIDLSDKSLSMAVDKVAGFLHKGGIADTFVFAVRGIIEKMGEGTIAVNGGKRVIVECFVSMETASSIRLVIRDTGISHPENFSSGDDFQEFVHYRYLNTLGCNRREFQLMPHCV